jgi:hypothetical protein
MLLKIVRSGKLQPSKLVTHRFAMNDIMKAYDTFGNAAKEGAESRMRADTPSERQLRVDPDKTACQSLYAATA